MNALPSGGGAQQRLAQPNGAFPLGVVEGFYGLPWPRQARLAMLRFLAAQDYSFYLYAPKSDRCLRADWRRDWSEEDYAHLEELALECRRLGLSWGIGLCPLGLTRCGAAERRALEARLASINRLQPDILCVLFDDIHAPQSAAASLQVQICHFLRDISPAQQIFFCPSYYSEDPRLEKLFGQRPPNYWQELGANLHPKIEIFYTGPKILNTRYQRTDFTTITTLLRRKPLLWDNYPVNDGAQSSHYLPLHPFRGRPAALRHWVSGHVSNPMNQPHLSQLPLRSLPAIYREGPTYNPPLQWQKALTSLQTPPLAHLLHRDLNLFATTGLEALSDDTRHHLRHEYEACPSPHAREVADWLRGKYTFDPACLTDSGQ